MLLGVDVGGTFTDAVLALEDGAIVTAKAPTTPQDQSQGVLDAVEAALDKAGRHAQEVSFFAHGMTVATNALLEGRGARTALVATEGFTDLIELGRQNRPDLYRLCRDRPAPLTPPELRFPAPERMTPAGPLRPLATDAAARTAQAVARAAPEAIAVVLLHSYAHPEHEQRLAHALRRTLPDTHVSLSHEVVGTFREYERAATTEIDAALSPLLARYLTRLVRRADDAGLPEPAIMQSNGGLIDAAAAARHAAWTVLSGPAAGAAGAAWAARRSGIENALCFDMGGTSCDVCVVDRHGVREQGAGEIAGRPLALPMLEVHTVGAGGGSIAWRDPGGALRVGPRSSGADPGPACYGRGGTEPTVTDANVVLGYLAPDAPLAGGIELRAEAATTAITHLAQQLGLDTTACAEGIVRVANAEMTRALRVVTVERGVDPRGYALVAFGGAGPLHAAAIAEELQIRTIVCPRASGVLAALGLITSARRRDAQRTVLLSGRALTRQAVAKAVAELGRRARDELGDPAAGGPAAELQAVYELRYRGQSFELPVGAGPEPSIEDLREAFDAAHEERYGYRDPEQELELVTIRVSATLSAPELPLAAETGAGAQSTRRRAILHGEEIEFEVLRGSPEAGARISGPAIVELPEATLLVPPTWSGEADSAGTIVLTR